MRRRLEPRSGLDASRAAAIAQIGAIRSYTQEQVAERMHATQTVVARLESGPGKPSTRTLERIGKATGSRLRIIL